MSDSDFYIGYKTHAPPRLAGFLRRTIALVILGGVALAVALAVSQESFDPGLFEYGIVRDFEGTVLEEPVPTLVVSSPEHSSFLLVAPGKFGAGPLVEAMDGREVRVRGSLIQRGDDAMIEVVPDSIRVVKATASPDPVSAMALGEHVLVGEIVDSKCYLGVMKPGRKKTHRACAVRCISGGIPPILRTTDNAGDPTLLLLTGTDGRPINQEILDFVAEPVEISGMVLRLGDQLVFRIDPSSIRRLNG